ncbi:aldehyde dehydrogenase family protein [Streptomyces flavidovirens]|uniref:aldehyde dehydrogenase family protein n=1 Tax=Streptomyces flavidovirens TaxID=67298 RepID=UPI00244A24F3|nr:aldehyde dehydrogenase family protein [Streptomyces flavidovirens]
MARTVPVQAEMGGLNAAVVLPDADIEQAAAHIAAAISGYGRPPPSTDKARRSTSRCGRSR